MCSEEWGDVSGPRNRPYPSVFMSSLFCLVIFYRNRVSTLRFHVFVPVSASYGHGVHCYPATLQYKWTNYA